MKEILKYKGILFDNFGKDNYGVWTTMCKECQNKYKDKVSKNHEIQGGTGGVCGVKGCTNSDWENDDIEVNYLDLDTNSIKWEMMG